MCNFISALKDEKNYFYLTKDDLKGKRFKEFKEENNRWQEDICGHGAINFFYPGIKGEHFECEDFSSVKNFPECIVEDIKKGNFEGIGICLDILNDKGRKEYYKIVDTAKKEHDKIVDPAWKEYYKIENSARKEYYKIVNPAKKEHDKIVDPAWKEYCKIVDPARKECYKIANSARKECDKIIQKSFWKIAKQKKYRKKEWK